MKREINIFMFGLGALVTLPVLFIFNQSTFMGLLMNYVVHAECIMMAIVCLWYVLKERSLTEDNVSNKEMFYLSLSTLLVLGTYGILKVIFGLQIIEGLTYILAGLVLAKIIISIYFGTTEERPFEEFLGKLNEKKFLKCNIKKYIFCTGILIVLSATTIFNCYIKGDGEFVNNQYAEYMDYSGTINEVAKESIDVISPDTLKYIKFLPTDYKCIFMTALDLTVFSINKTGDLSEGGVYVNVPSIIDYEAKSDVCREYVELHNTLIDIDARLRFTDKELLQFSTEKERAVLKMEKVGQNKEEIASMLDKPDALSSSINTGNIVLILVTLFYSFNYILSVLMLTISEVAYRVQLQKFRSLYVEEV